MSKEWRTSLAVLTAVIVLAALSGCGSTGGKLLDSVGLEPARTEQDAILYGYSQIEVVAGATVRLRKDKKISLETARKALESLKIAQAGLNSAADAFFLKDGASTAEHLKRFRILLEEVHSILGSSKPPEKPATKPKPASHWGAPVTG